MDLSKSLKDNYNIEVEDISPFTSKSYLVKCQDQNCYFLKRLDVNVTNKFTFLANQGVDNIIYPIINTRKQYATNDNQELFYLAKYLTTEEMHQDARGVAMCQNLNILHHMTYIPRQLSVNAARPKFDEISKQLDYKFKAIEQYIRSLETKPINQLSFLILENYQYILNARNEMARLQKKIILAIKDKESVNFSFIHNKPSTDHLLYSNGNKYLTSVENGKIGIQSFDLAKFYIENEDLNLDYKKLLVGYFQGLENEFYYDYFRYLVLLIIIKKVQINGQISFTSSTFASCGRSIQRYFEIFSDNQEQVKNANYS